MIVYLILVKFKLHRVNSSIILNIRTFINDTPPMTILVLNIDRDDDFGRKAKIQSPIIGLEPNLEAASALGKADPEDSDLNAIYLAIKTYQDLLDDGQDVKIATICGHISVGIKSDQILARQLDRTIEHTKASEVIVVSDGAEDEYILPIVESRIKINSIQRVCIKQSKELEDTYYRVLKILDDDKVKKQFLLPFALILIVWAVFVTMDMASSGLGAILLTLGLYLLVRVFNWERTIAIMAEEIKSGFLTGKLSFYTSILAILITGVSVFYAWNLTQPDINEDILWAIPMASFLSHVVWGVVIAGLIVAFGRVTDMYVREKKIHWSYWIVPFSLLTFGFISNAVFESLYISLHNDFSIEPFLTPTFIGYTTVGILIAFIGAITYHYIKELYIYDEQELEIQEHTATITDE